MWSPGVEEDEKLSNFALNLFEIKQVKEKNVGLSSHIRGVRSTPTEKSELSVPVSATGDDFWLNLLGRRFW